MDNKKMVFNENTKLFEEVVESVESDSDTFESIATKSVKRRKTLSIWLIILIPSISLIITTISVMFAYYQSKNDAIQTEVAKDQLELNTREFDITKMPQLGISSVESEDLYDKDKYCSSYIEWLYDNNIEDFIGWQYLNWCDGKFDYDLKYSEYISQDFVGDYILYPETVWRLYRYASDAEEAAYFNGTLTNGEFTAGSYYFWKAYIYNDQESLLSCTNGEFEELQSEYESYLSKSGYKDYESWKSLYKYEIKTIIVENTGAVINNAKLDVYIYNKYIIESGEKTYCFGIDMCNEYISEYYTGQFDNLSYNYDVINKTFTINFETDVRYASEDGEYERLNQVLYKDMYEKLKTPKGDIIDNFVAGIPCVYFCVSYLDIEGIQQQDWYLYDIYYETLHIINKYKTNLEEPEYRPLDLEYNAEYSAYIAEILGYTNSQYKRVEWFDMDNTYIDLAEEKMIEDINKYFGK